jgi:hypothetical protein
MNRNEYRFDIQRLTRHQRKRIAEENLTSNYSIDVKDEFLSIENDAYHCYNKRLRLRSRIIETFVSTFLKIFNESFLFSRQSVYQIANHQETQNETRESQLSRSLLETFF